MKWELGCRTKTKTIYEKIIEAIIEIATMELVHAQPQEQQ